MYAGQAFHQRHGCPQRTAERSQHHGVDHHRVKQQQLVRFQQRAGHAQDDPRQRNHLGDDTQRTRLTPGLAQA